MDRKQSTEQEDGISELLGSVPLLQQNIKLEVKPDKSEPRILVITEHRICLLHAKYPNKIENSINFFDLTKVESDSIHKMTLEGEGKSSYPITVDDSSNGNIDGIITAIGNCLQQLVPESPFQRGGVRFQVSPEDRWQEIQTNVNEVARESGPCGNFTRVYKCVCNRLGMPYMADVAWDIDTIYFAQNTHELNLGDFEYIESRGLVPILASLEYNTWFTKLNSNNVKLNNDACYEILKVLKKNTTIEELHLSNTGVKSDFTQKLALSLVSNTNSPLSVLDLSNNFIEDKGMTHIQNFVSRLHQGLKRLDLSKTGMTAKGLARLTDALCSNRFMTTSLVSLDLSGNQLKSEEQVSLQQFLAKPNKLRKLNLANTEFSIEMKPNRKESLSLFGSLLNGCTQHLADLDLSGCSLGPKKGKDLPVTWKQFFAEAAGLQRVVFSNTKLTADALKMVLLGIASNQVLKDLHLDLSSNDLRGTGAEIFANCFPSIQSIVSLDISDNGFDNETSTLCQSLSKNSFLERLSIGKNFAGVKPKHLPNVLESLVQMIQEDNSRLEYLSIADSKLKQDTTFLINALGSNYTLKEIDLSGNQMEDIGVRMLAKAIQINSSLRTIHWDRNGTTWVGFQYVAAALEKNYSLKKMPMPLQDASLSLKLNSEKTEAALSTIESLIQRNHSPQPVTLDQTYRLQQGILISASKKWLKKQCQQVEESISVLEGRQLSLAAQNDIKHAKSLLDDAGSTSQLMPEIQEAVNLAEAVNNEIENQLKDNALDFRDCIQEQLMDIQERMIGHIEKACPSLLADKDFKKEMLDSCNSKMEISDDYYDEMFLDVVGTDVLNKINELRLSLASHLSDKVIDGILDSLEDVQKKLVSHIKNPDATSKDREEPKLSEMDMGENALLQRIKDRIDPDSPKSTLKRRSMYNRRLRPQSVIGPANEKKDSVDAPSPLEGTTSSPANASTPQPASRTTLPSASSSEPGDPFDTIAPMSPTQPLEHLAKHRPRRAKTKAASRATVFRGKNEDDADVSRGVNEFFERRIKSEDLSSTDINKVNNHTEEKVVEDKPKEEASVKPAKKGWSPFGQKTDVKGLASGISNFFAKKEKAARSPEGELSKPEPTSHSPKVEKKSISRERSPRPRTDSGSPSSLRRTRVVASDAPQEEKETSRKTEEEVKKPEEPAPEVSPSTRGVSRYGVPTMPIGGGPNILAELKQRRATMKTKADDNKENQSDMNTIKPPAKERPVPSPRSASPASEKSGSSPGSRPVSAMRPPPPTKPKPKPPGVAPKPKPGGISPVPTAKPTPAVRGSVIGSSNSSSSSTSTPVTSTGSIKVSETIGDDDKPSDSKEAPGRPSRQRRSSVKDKIAALDRNSNETPDSGVKQSKLPREQTADSGEGLDGSDSIKHGSSIDGSSGDDLDIQVDPPSAGELNSEDDEVVMV